MKSSSKIIFALLLGSGALRTFACDSCSLYLAGDADLPGLTLSVAHQFTRLGTVWSGDQRMSNPIDQYLDSHVTQLTLGYSRGGAWLAQLTLPHISRSYRRPDHALVENGRENGPGDATLALRYRLWQTVSTEGDQFEVGLLGGIKFATGNAARLEPADHVHHHFVPSGVHEHDLALGSGSTDWLVGAHVAWKRGRWSAQLQMQQKLRRPGAFAYRFADETTWELAAGRTVVAAPSQTVAMQVLMTTERKGLDAIAGAEDDDSGANVHYLGARVVVTRGTRLDSDLSLELPVRIRTTAIMVVPDYRVRAAVNWRF